MGAVQLNATSCFNPRRPRGRRLQKIVEAQEKELFQSTPPARAATAGRHARLPANSVSIHAAREGGDGIALLPSSTPEPFQSTPPARAATASQRVMWWWGLCFNPRRPRGRRRRRPSRSSGHGRFNPRRPRGRRPERANAKYRAILFQSTPPARAATAAMSPFPRDDGVSIHAAREGGDHSSGEPRQHWRVSIHAAREGGDSRSKCFGSIRTCFNPRRPRGRRHDRILMDRGEVPFQSTPPARAATPTGAPAGGAVGVSIHAAREGGDAEVLAAGRLRYVSIHAAREGGDMGEPFQAASPPSFQSTPPARAATM